MCIRDRLRNTWKTLHRLRETTRAPQNTDEYHADIQQMTNDLHSDVWSVLSDAEKIGRCFRQQRKRVATKLTSLSPQPSTIPSASGSPRKPKSKNRQEAGKAKAESLRAWREEVAAARQELKAEGYEGSLWLKKGSAVYEKMQARKQAKLGTPGA